MHLIFFYFLALEIYFIFCNWHACACSYEVHACCSYDEDIGIENRELNVENKQVPLLSFPAGQLFCISPPGGGVPVPPLPIHWYYIMAAGGALLLLAVAILVRALCCCRQHLATKKSQLSVAYHSSSQCFQYSNWSSSMATPGVEPVLTVRLDSRDRHRTLCWKEALSRIVFWQSRTATCDVSGSVCRDAARLTEHPLDEPLSPLVYRCKGETAKWKHCALSLSLSLFL